ncbi:MAG: FAD:protein FMN transferase, partial [Woeseiaceae bacterium]|nr:FAD:protein FMN transferase [Woeseiaceae bacterium]
PTVGYLVTLWGFDDYEDPKSLPDQSAIKAAIADTGYRRVQVDCENQQVRKHGNVSIDLSGYVKGFAADEIRMLLNQADIYAALVEIGGEVAALRSNRSPGWRIAIETPGMPNTRPLDVVRLYSQGIATSGNYRNYYEVDEVRYSHVIDPASGLPVRHNTVSVSVVADSTMEADAWATALLVMGTERGLEAAEKNRIAAFFVDRVGDTLTTTSSTGFDKVFR